jgi:hypothetical protein
VGRVLSGHLLLGERSCETCAVWTPTALPGFSLRISVVSSQISDFSFQFPVVSFFPLLVCIS